MMPLSAALTALPLWIAQLPLRLGVALVFWKSGLTKVLTNEAGTLPVWPPTLAAGVVDLFAEEYRLPLLPADWAAPLAAGVELAAAALLILGLASRLSAAALLAVTLTIQLLVFPGNWAEHLLWGGALLLIIIRGAGPLALDQLIARR